MITDIQVNDFEEKLSIGCCGGRIIEEPDAVVLDFREQNLSKQISALRKERQESKKTTLQRMYFLSTKTITLFFI